MKYLLFVSVIMTAFSGSALADQGDEICAELLQFEEQTSRDLPVMVDEITELYQVKVNCDTETVSYSRRIFGLGLFADGWQDRKQRQHTQLHCNQQGLASQTGWTALDVIVDDNFRYVATLTTRPSDCF